MASILWLNLVHEIKSLLECDLLYHCDKLPQKGDLCYTVIYQGSGEDDFARLQRHISQQNSVLYNIFWLIDALKSECQLFTVNELLYLSPGPLQSMSLQHFKTWLQCPKRRGFIWLVQQNLWRILTKVLIGESLKLTVSYHFPPLNQSKEFIIPTSSREVGEMVVSNMAIGTVKCQSFKKQSGYAIYWTWKYIFSLTHRSHA